MLFRSCYYTPLDNVFTATALVEKWKRVSKELEPARKAFNDIRDASGKERSKDWEELAKDADARRATDVSAMDIYDMHRNNRKLVYEYRRWNR